MEFKIEINGNLKDKIAELDAIIKQWRNMREAIVEEAIPDFTNCECPAELQPCSRMENEFVMDLCDCCDPCREICAKRINSRLKL